MKSQCINVGFPTCETTAHTPSNLGLILLSLFLEVTSESQSFFPLFNPVAG